MANQLENLLTKLAPRDTGLPQGAVLALVLFLLFAAVVLAVLSRNWVLTVSVVAAAAGVTVFAYGHLVQSRRRVAFDGVAKIRWEAVLPAVQRQNLKLEVSELSRILETGPGQESDLQSAYLVAEDLALRQIQQDEKAPLLRHASVCGSSFSGVLIKDDLLICVEVYFLISPELRQDRVDAMMRKMEQVRRELGHAEAKMRTRLMVILITQLSPDDAARLRVNFGRKRFPDTPVDIDIRFLDFEALQRIYVTD